MKGRFVEFVIYSNLLITVAAIFQCLLTYFLINQPINFDIIVMVGTSTLLLYNYSLFLSIPIQGSSSSPKMNWLFRNKILFWILTVLAIIILLYSVIQIQFPTLFFLILVGGVALAYSFPFLKIDGRFVGIRQLPGLKVFVIGIVWSLTCVGLPIVELQANAVAIDWLLIVFVGIANLVFLLVCTLPFDIRDIRQDDYYRLKTIPVLIGISKTKRLVYFLLLAHVLLVSFSPFGTAAIFGLILVDGFAFCSLRYVFRKPMIYFSDVYLLDFLLIIQSVAVLVALL